MLNVAIVGMGTISVIHLEAIKLCKNVNLVSVCDTDTTLEKDYLDYKFYDDLKTMLESEKLDVVHICLPHYLHVMAAKLCAEHNVNVFTEKPVALTYTQAMELFDLEKKYGIKIGVCLQNRYNATTIEMKNIIDKNLYGNILGCKGIVTWNRENEYYDSKPWRGKMDLAGGGCMINQTVHTLDLLQYLVGDVLSIKGKIASLQLDQIEVEDTSIAHLDFGNNVTGIYFATITYCTNSSVEIEIVMEKARVVIKDSKLYVYEDENVKCICEDQKLEGSKHYYGASHFTCISTFYEALLNNTNEYIKVIDAAKPIKLIDKIVESNSTGKRENINYE